MADQLVLDGSVERLAEVPARRLLAAMMNPKLADRARSKAPPTRAGGANEPPTIGELLRAADASMNAAGDVGLTLAFEKVKVLDAQAGGFDWGRGEIYVITSILDGSGEQPDFKTRSFEGIHDGDPLPLGDGGMLVGMMKNPRWFVDMHMVVMESDSDIREIGTSIEQARKESGLSNAIKAVGAVAAFDPTMISKVVTVVDTFLVILSGILKANGDDHVATVHDFYLRHQGFGAGRHPRSGVQGFQDVEAAYKIDLTTL